MFPGYMLVSIRPEQYFGDYMSVSRGYSTSGVLWKIIVYLQQTSSY